MGFFDFPLIFISLPITLIIVIIIAYLIVFIIGGICYVYSIFLFKRKDWDYTGKHIFIFGGSAGVGQAIALRLAKKGVHLSIASRSENKLKETQEKCLIENSKTTCDYYICDMGNTEDVKKALEQAVKKYGIPSLLINSAGIAHPGFIEDMTYEQYEKDMDLNYFGCLRMMKEIKILLDSNPTKERIDIVCIGSCLGLIGSIGYTAYCPTKFAIKGLLDSLRFEFLGTNVHLHYYAPSNMDTPGFAIENEHKPKLVASMENNVQTVTADYAAHALLCNLDRYVITSEPDLDLLKNGPTFMSSHTIQDFLICPLSALGTTFYRMMIEKNILKNVDHKKD
ncbi:hypothetical protein ENUP19_0202G0013 [Entamoeba nuttalli]|uniref:3-dehydrosphinganine reductase n=2 Tax=Entamoeba nuttalli TaxID=412467 RepID=K2GHC2_ENTNP|nr:3-ketodihydrosphingosine reductase protein, putative [Entamoeba nuttalli P19]EKE42096.1 3-ketodihydrosphingosine reductase protein, putative [Entamoeba nuttalli P19]|eukprot:XP_008855568.1 3-ketodihydrosphingosine reductase protein, putative [Entamoeba nuttalli P19]